MPTRAEEKQSSPEWRVWLFGPAAAQARPHRVVRRAAAQEDCVGAAHEWRQHAILCWCRRAAAGCRKYVMASKWLARAFAEGYDEWAAKPRIVGMCCGV